MKNTTAVTTGLMLFLPALLHATKIDVIDPFAPGDGCGSAQCDVIGDRLEFDIQKASVQINASGLSTADLYFNFGPGNAALSPFNVAGLQLNVGDLFFTQGGVAIFALPLMDHTGSPNGGMPDTLAAGHLYQINNSSGLLTAQQVLNNPSGVVYRNNIDVWVHNDGKGSVTDLGTGTVNILGGGDGVNTAKFHVTLSFTAPQQLVAASNVNGFGLQFESATCGNDVIAGTAATVSGVPEPFTSVLMGSGLLGLGLIRPRKK